MYYLYFDCSFVSLVHQIENPGLHAKKSKLRYKTEILIKMKISKRH